jgi:hypothetical protein
MGMLSWFPPDLLQGQSLWTAILRPINSHAEIDAEIFPRLRLRCLTKNPGRHIRTPQSNEGGGFGSGQTGAVRVMDARS